MIQELLLHALKVQPVFISVCEGSSRVASHAYIHEATKRFCGGGGASVLGQRARLAADGSDTVFVRAYAVGKERLPASPLSNISTDAPSNVSLWATLQRVLLPVTGTGSLPSSAPQVAGSQGAAALRTRPRPDSTSTKSSEFSSARWASEPATAAAAGSSAQTARQQQEQQAAQRQAARKEGDVFKSMSKQGENFAGTLLKGAVVLITIPLAVHLMAKSMLVTLCVKGLDSKREETVCITLKRVRQVIVSDYLAARFEADDGVVLLMSTFHAAASPGVLRDYLLAVQQLLKFPSTREGLLLSSLVDRLERAVRQGWLPEDIRGLALDVLQDARGLQAVAAVA